MTAKKCAPPSSELAKPQIALTPETTSNVPGTCFRRPSMRVSQKIHPRPTRPANENTTSNKLISKLPHENVLSSHVGRKSVIHVSRKNRVLNHTKFETKTRKIRDPNFLRTAHSGS